MRDPSLDANPARAASTPPSRPRAAFSSTQRGIETFHALQVAMFDTYSALPPEAQTALLRRGASANPFSSTPTPADTQSSSSVSRSSRSSGAETTYLASRDASRNYEQRAPATPALQRSYADYRSRPQPPSATWGQSLAPSSPQHVPLHRVYILRCMSCNTFLSDRGMRAVLLLKPNVVLFSTDASPTNAGPLWPDMEEDAAERTCDCLTSSMGCHGCGAVVGYHIVQPCARCTSSVQQHSRSANHHRYVFHHNEVVARERQYFAGEPGITGVRYTHPSSRSPTPSPRLETEGKDDGSSRRHRSPQAPPLQEASRLHAGDVLYWHNLVAGGERPAPVDPDSRPRRCTIRAGR